MKVSEYTYQNSNVATVSGNGSLPLSQATLIYEREFINEVWYLPNSKSPAI